MASLQKRCLLIEGIEEYKSATIHVPKPNENITKEKKA